MNFGPTGARSIEAGKVVKVLETMCVESGRVNHPCVGDPLLAAMSANHGVLATMLRDMLHDVVNVFF